jgi:hypothetical protein
MDRPDPEQPGPQQSSPGQRGAEQAGAPAGAPALPDRVRRRLDEVFGDVLPEVTRDEVDGTPHDPTAADGDRWLRANRPPHHDGRT